MSSPIYLLYCFNKWIFFALLIPAGILLMGSTFNPSLFLDLIFYIILTPIASLIMNKIMFSSQNWMIAKQSLLKIEKKY